MRLAQSSKLETRTAFDIPAQPLGASLKQVADQAGIQILFEERLVSGIKAPEIRANQSALETLQTLLKGTDLEFTAQNETVAVRSSKPAATTAAGSQKTSLRIAQNTESTDPQEENKGAESSPKNPDEDSKAQLEEIVVSAQKRLERLQDVPVPVTTLSGQTLLERGQLRIQDYYATVPGLSLTSSGIGDTRLSIRGITTGGNLTNPTVGVTVDDVPFGTSTGFSSWTSAPDIDPSDLARIEVLRGPQGTLYGASSIGGLLKYVTIDPSTAGFAGRVQVDVNGVSHGDGAGYGLRGSVNVPLGDSFAIRASGFTRSDPGYIDDPGLGIEGLNQIDVDGARVSALWRPSQVWSLKLSALYQNTEAEGMSDVPVQPPGVQPLVGDLQQALTLRRGGFQHRLGAYSAILSADLGAAELVSITGYSVDDYERRPDLSNYYGAPGIAASVDRFGVDGASAIGRNKTNKFTQEVRFSGAFQSRYDWLFGLYYAHDDNPSHDRSFAVDPASMTVAGLLLDDVYPTTFAEYAAFGDLTVHFTERFDVQFGGRQSENKQRYEETIAGPLWEFFGLTSPSINPPVHTKDDAFTYLLTPRWRISPDVMAYARFASGYRPGGPNTTCISFNLPCQYDPDKTNNYELGLKGDALDRRVSYEASVYYIDWKDIQIQLADPSSGFIYYTNASRAKSQGIELSGQARPLEGLTLSAWVALNEAELTEDLPPDAAAVGFSGDRLPYSSRVSGSFSVEQEFALTSQVNAFVGGSVSYVGGRKGNFAAPADASRLELPSYTVGNLRAGARYESWALNLFVNNLSDKRGVLSIGPSGFFTTSATYIQPRKVGMSLVKTF